MKIHAGLRTEVCLLIRPGPPARAFPDLAGLLDRPLRPGRGSPVHHRGAAPLLYALDLRALDLRARDFHAVDAPAAGWTGAGSRPAPPASRARKPEGGSCADWYGRDLRIRRGMMGSLSGGLASMGAAVPCAIAAKVAHPDRPVISPVGDGAMQMNDMAELITVAKDMHRWPNKTWVCCVFNNEDLNQVTWEQRVNNGNPKFDASRNLPNVPYHKFAELIGLKGLYVDDPEALGAAWDEALASPVPVVLEVKTDPEVPPLPPHITFAQAEAFMSTLLKGDPKEGHVLVDTARQVLSSVLPGHRK